MLIYADGVCRYLQYSGIAIAVAHEITHGFDDEGYWWHVPCVGVLSHSFPFHICVVTDGFNQIWQGGACLQKESCTDVKNYKWRLNPVWHRMLYSCTHMATEGFKGLTTVSRRCRSATGRDVFRTPCASPFQTTLILADGFFVENQNCLGIHYQKSCGLRGTSSNSPPTGVLPLDPTGDFLDPLLAIEGLGSLQWGPGAKLAHFFPAF